MQEFGNLSDLVLHALEVLILAVTAVYVSQQVKHMRQDHELVIELERRKKALEFISRFNENHMVETRSKAVAAQHQNQLTAPPGLHSVLALLNFYDEMALAILNGLADEDICRRFFRNIILYTCTGFASVLNENATGYLYLKELNKKWQQVPEPIASLL